MTDRNWALFTNLHFLDKPVFAAQFVRKTAKSVVFIAFPERDDASETRREIDWLLAEGLTEEAAKDIAEKAAKSLEIARQEIKAANRYHETRLKALIDNAKS